MSLRILIAHNGYQLQGGEDSVVANESRLLKENGHNVSLYMVSNEVISSVKEKITTFVNVPYSPKARHDFDNRIASFKPDLIHVHNFFPLLTPSIYDACIDADIPIVQTLHNYRTICPGALLMRDGVVCEKCVKGSFLWAVWHRCYRNSIFGSIAVARMASFHRKLNTWGEKVDLFIALTEFSRQRFISGGFPEERVVVKPNFVNYSSVKSVPLKKGALFVGRLSSEKGILTLIHAWKNIDYPLRIVGEGPLLTESIDLATTNVEFLGQLSSELVKEEMEAAAFLVLPTLCFENFPMTIGEAYACSLPVIVSRLGVMLEIVEDGVTGLHFQAGNANDLALKVRWAIAHYEQLVEMGENARTIYEEKYTADKNYQLLMNIYQRAISDGR